MYKIDLKKCKRGNKGITLIALIITIIVLLILAGVTIAMLTGSESAPNKANEAKQKNDIGTAQDEVSLAAQNAQMEAYQIAYVETGVQAKDASTVVGNYVKRKLNEKYGDTGTFKTGIATITSTLDGNITIWTTDFEITGQVEQKGGNIIWGEIVPNTPGVFLNKTAETLGPSGILSLTARKKDVSESITWSKVSGGASSISVTENPSDNLKATVNVTSGASDGDTATIKATAGGYEATCTITVEKLVVTNVAFSSTPSEIHRGESIVLTITTTGNGGKIATASSVTFETKKETENSGSVTLVQDENDNKKAVLTGTNEGGPITIKATADGVSAQFNVTVIPSIIGQYVEYGVSYTDMFVADIFPSTPEADGFTSTNGWRILEPGTPNGDGSYSGTRIISTGVPAKLYYHYNSNIDSYNTWWDLNQTNIPAKAASGLRNARIPVEGGFRGFEAIIFEHKSDNLIANMGGYININGTTSGNLTAEVFKTNQAASVATLTENDIYTSLSIMHGDVYKGNLIYLGELTEFGYNSDTYFNYWLATPYGTNWNVMLVSKYGGINYNSDNMFGVRPVVTLKNNYKIVKNTSSGRWEIVEKN